MKTIWSWVDRLVRAVIAGIGRPFPKLGAMCEKLWENTELIAYLLTGVATTLVNYVAYFQFTRLLGLAVLPGTWAAWAVAVAFGYVANKRFVFRTRCAGLWALLCEAASFVAMRLVSLGMETVLMYLTVEVVGLNDLLMKLITNFVVIVLNYIFSKLVIFKK